MEDDHLGDRISPECPESDNGEVDGEEGDLDFAAEEEEEEDAEDEEGEEGEPADDEDDEDADNVEEMDQEDNDSKHDHKSDNNPSTYESISEIVMDKPFVTANSLGVKPFCESLFPAKGVSSDPCMSADISSMSFNTVPEELSPPEPTAMDIDIDAIHTAYHTGEDNEDSPDSDADAEEYSDELNEDEPPEAMGSRSGRGATTTQQTHRNAGSKRKRKAKSPSALKRAKSASRKDKLKQKVQTKGKQAAQQRDLIKPENRLDTNAPRRPMSAFKIFMNEFRTKYSTKYPNISFAEMTDIGADVWRDMPAPKKQEFQEEANRQQDAYLTQMKEYQSKRQQERSSKPKTAYQIFMSDYLNKEYEKRKNLKTQSRLTKQDLFMRGVRKWNRLSKIQKRPYEEQSCISKTSQPHLNETVNTPPSSSKKCLVQISGINNGKSVYSNLKRDREAESPKPKKQRRIEFSEEDEVGQFQPDDTLATWFQATKRCR